MIPIKDTIRSQSFPIVNWMILISLVLVWFVELSMPRAQLAQVIFRYGLVPAAVQVDNPASFLPFLSHMFLHGGWLHFLSNAWVLFIFGDNVEDRLGSGLYLLFYLAGGVAAGTLQYLVNPASQTPAIGASGAIAAVMGAYFLFFPRSRVISFIPIFIIPWFIEVPAIVFLGFWFVTQLFSGVTDLAQVTSAGGGVAWWAHVGGFAFGFLIALPFILFRRKPRVYPDEYYPW